MLVDTGPDALSDALSLLHRGTGVISVDQPPCVRREVAIGIDRP